MIRILHTSDWHLGKRLERFSRHEEQIAIMDEIIGIAEQEKVDVVVVAGDLFDTFNPPAESLDLFYKSLKRLTGNGKRPVIAIAGNHDMPERIEAPDPLARECGIIFAGFPDSRIHAFSIEEGFSLSQSDAGFIELQLPGKPPLRVLLTPYANELRLRKGLLKEDSEEELRQLLGNSWSEIAEKHCDKLGVNILVAHLLFMNEGEEMPEEPEDERPINHVGGAQAIYTSLIPDKIQYVALGHLHRRQLVSGTNCPVIYSGSPICYSFSEAGQQKQVVIIDLEPGKKAEYKYVNLKSGKKLERKRFDQLEEAENWLNSNQDSLVELTLVSDSYLSGNDRRHLHEIHSGIVAIIPEIRTKDEDETPEVQSPFQSKNIQALFKEYFMNKKGQEPDKDLLDLFMEINAQEEEA
jgi:DNA repair protein SbcD/Mre11